ncbi:mycothiol synthase [Cellulomonas sp. DKR-3]|uniref:Mycothiol acetyltransferase n=1 Tax=Cellulomonas fulva TaxID=2835530 RepID=A0ABS5TYA7_9CELL|nr:mycothiol synthase [Cellulomonas fulva]MBT0994135.1 mycothiol synthase [Cellulomonas fulva]
MVEPTRARVAVDVRAGALGAEEADAVRRLVADAAAQDGVAPVSEQPLLWLRSDEAPVVHVLARSGAAADGELAGYAQVDVGATTSASAELVVHPSARREGVGTALLTTARETAARVPDRTLRVWAHGATPAARSFAAAVGMPVVRELWRMSLDLADRPDRPDRPLPPHVTVRPFVPGEDEEAWRRVNSRAFAYHPEQGRMTSADLRAREAEAWFDPAGFLLAEREGLLLGSVWTKVHAAGELGDEPVGEIYVVGVDPDAQGLGLGGALTDLGLTHLAARGLRRAVLYTGAENEVAIRTYRRVGFEPESVDVMFGSDTPGSPGGVTMAP